MSFITKVASNTQPDYLAAAADTAVTMYHRNTDPVFKTTPSCQVRSSDQTPLVDEADLRRRSIPSTAYSSEPPDLQPVKPPLGPRPQSDELFRSRTIVLVMREKISSDFVFCTASGESIAKCKTKLASMHGRKTFTDMGNQELFTVSSTVFAVHKSFRAQSSTREHNFEVKSTFELAGSRSQILFKNAFNGQETLLELAGKWRDKAAEIRYGDQVVASISKTFFNPQNFFGEKQTYFVAVAPNVDLSMIAGVCVCLDERDREANG